MTLNYKELVSDLNGALRGANNNIKLVEQAKITEQQKYPFGSYTITNPYMNERNYRNHEDDSLNQVIEMVFSYTFYDTSFFTTSEILQKSITNLRLRGTIQDLTEKGIVIVDVTNVGNRDNFISIQTERRSGFDVRIRVRNIATKPIEYIDNVEVEQVDGI